MLPTPAPIPDNRLLCPSGEDSCKGIKDVMANGDYIGVGLNDISKGASLYAVFDGKLMTSKMISPKGETFWVVYLLNPVEKKEAAYWFKGVEIKAKDVKKGDIIATTSAEPLNDFHGSNFIFTLIDASGSAIELKPEDFK